MPSQGEAGHHGHLDTYVMGACTDVPATAPQHGRVRPWVTVLPILRLARCGVQGDSCPVSRSGSKRCVIGFLCEKCRRW
jgi:hypothetical protein